MQWFIWIPSILTKLVIFCCNWYGGLYSIQWDSWLLVKLWAAFMAKWWQVIEFKKTISSNWFYRLAIICVDVLKCHQSVSNISIWIIELFDDGGGLLVNSSPFSQRRFLVEFSICLNRGKRRKCCGEGEANKKNAENAKQKKCPNTRVFFFYCHAIHFFFLLLLLLFFFFFFFFFLHLLHLLRLLRLHIIHSSSDGGVDLFLSRFSSFVVHERYWFSIRFVWIFGSSFSRPICASIVARVSLMVNCPYFFSFDLVNYWFNFYIDVNYAMYI